VCTFPCGYDDRKLFKMLDCLFNVAEKILPEPRASLSSFQAVVHHEYSDITIGTPRVVAPPLLQCVAF
jgi:hypothetical protein